MPITWELSYSEQGTKEFIWLWGQPHQSLWMVVLPPLSLPAGVSIVVSLVIGAYVHEDCVEVSKYYTILSIYIFHPCTFLSIYIFLTCRFLTIYIVLSCTFPSIYIFLPCTFLSSYIFLTCRFYILHISSLYIFVHFHFSSM